MVVQQRRTRRVMSDINVVPYIDVMLVLLVIFMVTAPLLTQGVDVDLPQAATEPLQAEDEEPLIVTVDREGRLYLNVYEQPDQPIESEALRRRVAALLNRNPRIPVLVRGDRDVVYGNVVAAMAVLQSAGAAKVGLMTEPPPAAGRRGR